MATALLAGILAIGALGAVTGNTREVGWSDGNKLWAWILEYAAAAYYFGANFLEAPVTKAWATVHGTGS